jgi:hypothetical protein
MDGAEPVLLLGAGASITSGIPAAGTTVEKAARWAWCKEHGRHADDFTIRRSDYWPWLPVPARNLAREQLIIALQIYERNGNQHGYPASDADLDAIIALYDAYDAAGGSPSDPLKGLDLDAALRIAIQEGYELTQVGRRLASIRSSLMQGVERCPICGISAPRVLDHHLPKAHYLAFAIYVRNLVPLCAECNQYKSAAASPNPAERFIHPYFDTLPDIRFLRAAVSIENNALIAEFGLDPAVELPGILAARLDYQIARLRLNARYAHEINSYVTSHTTALHICFDALGAHGVRDYLNRQASVEFGRFNTNHWRPVLLLALANHNEFCEAAFRDILPLTPPQVLLTAVQAIAAL